MLDLACVFEPPRVPEVEFREVAAINLLLASIQRGQTVSGALSKGYIMVDRGPVLSMSHVWHFPDLPATASTRRGMLSDIGRTGMVHWII